MTAIDTSTEAVERLLDGVTPGPWQSDSVFMDRDHEVRVAMPDDCGVPMATIAEAFHNWNDVTDVAERRISWKEAEANARFIAAARDLVPALLKERDEARAALAASQPADPVTNAGCRQPVKVKPLVWTDFANVSVSPDDDAVMDDNLAVALCSYFDSRMDCPDDEEEGAELDEYDCWKVWVSENAEKVLRRIAKAANDHILAALEASPHVNETPKSEHDSADVLTALPAADRAEAALAAQIEAAIREIWCLCEDLEDEAYAKLKLKLTEHEQGFWAAQKMTAKRIRRATQMPTNDRTALDRLLAEAEAKALRRAAKACDWGDIYGDNAVKCILALIPKEDEK